MALGGRFTAVLVARQFFAFSGTFGAIVGIIQADLVFATDGKGHFHAIAQKFAFDLGFEQKIAAIADNEEFWDRAAITQAAMPRSHVVGIGCDEPALLFILAAKVISIEITTVNGFVHCT